MGTRLNEEQYTQLIGKYWTHLEIETKELNKRHLLTERIEITKHYEELTKLSKKLEIMEQEIEQYNFENRNE